MNKFRLIPILTFLVFFSLSSQLIGQIRAVKTLQRIETPKLNVYGASKPLILVPMKFNESVTKAKFKDIPMDQIESVSLVYTKFKLSETFSQAKLNYDRTNELYSIFPELRNNKTVKWYWVGQTGCYSPGACRGYFHGFVIQLRSAADSAAVKMESPMLSHYMDMYSGSSSSSYYLDSISVAPGSTIKKTCDTSYYVIHDRSRRSSKIKAKSTKSSKRLARKLNKYIASDVDEINFTMSAKNKLSSMTGVEGKGSQKEILALIKHYYSIRPGKYKGMKSASNYTLFLDRNSKGKIKLITHESHLVDNEGRAYEDFSNIEMVKERIHCYYFDTLKKAGSSSVNDVVVSRVFERNKEWNNALIAKDVTGSMSPYVAQFLLWHKLYASKSSKNFNYVFFNDGDNKPDALKIAGQVGGLYYTQTKNFTKLKYKVSEAMANGGGGDGPENNIEAVINGLEKNPNVKEVIMIADNWATPRDLSLLGQVNKPIWLVLCGASKGANVAYLNMIKENGGSVHTMEEDLVNLSKLKEGETLNIGAYSYKVQNGKFVKI